MEYQVGSTPSPNSDGYVDQLALTKIIRLKILPLRAILSVISIR